MYVCKKKDFFQLYYKNNGEKMRVYETPKYIKEHRTGLIRSYKKQQPENKIIMV